MTIEIGPHLGEIITAVTAVIVGAIYRRFEKKQLKKKFDKDQCEKCTCEKNNNNKLKTNHEN